MLYEGMDRLFCEVLVTSKSSDASAGYGGISAAALKLRLKFYSNLKLQN